MSEIMTKHRSPAKKIRSMKRLLTFMLIKLKQISLPSSETSSSSDQAKNSITLNDFLKISRSISQDNEDIRRKEREKDLRNFETFLAACPGPGFPLPHM